MVHCGVTPHTGAIISHLKAACARLSGDNYCSSQTDYIQKDEIKMFCEPTLWSMACNEQVQKPQSHYRDPVCLVEISSDRSVPFEDMSGEGWISEHKTPSKQDLRAWNKPQKAARSQILHSVKSAKFWTFLQFKTSTQA